MIRTAIDRFLQDDKGATDDLADIAGHFSPLPMNDLKPHDRQWADAAIAFDEHFKREGFLLPS